MQPAATLRAALAEGYRCARYRLPACAALTGHAARGGGLLLSKRITGAELETVPLIRRLCLSRSAVSFVHEASHGVTGLCWLGVRGGCR